MKARPPRLLFINVPDNYLWAAAEMACRYWKDLGTPERRGQRNFCIVKSAGGLVFYLTHSKTQITIRGPR